MEFSEFIDSARKLTPEEFYASDVGRNNLIDASWWREVEPKTFLVFADLAWFAQFATGACFAYIEGKDYIGSAPELTKLLFDWFNENSP